MFLLLLLLSDDDSSHFTMYHVSFVDDFFFQCIFSKFNLVLDSMRYDFVAFEPLLLHFLVSLCIPELGILEMLSLSEDDDIWHTLLLLEYYLDFEYVP